MAIHLSKADKMVAIQMLGQPPSFDDANDINDTELVHRYRDGWRYYTYFYDVSDLRKYVIDYLKKTGRSDEDISSYKRTEVWRTSATVASSCLMITSFDAPFFDGHESFIETRLDELIQLGRGKKQDKAKADAPTKERVGVRQRVVEHARAYISEIENVVDDVDTDFGMYQYITGKNIGGPQVKIIGDYYRPLRDELKSVLDKTDLDLCEGYKGVLKSDTKALHGLVDSIIKDCETYSANQSRSRKPRKKKAKSADKIVSKLNYRKEDVDLKLVSINPVKIIGSSMFVGYNPTNNTLHVYAAIDRGGLTIERSMIKNFDPEKSYIKKIGRRVSSVNSIASGGIRAIKNGLKTFTSKPNEATGRLGKNIILINAAK